MAAGSKTAASVWAASSVGPVAGTQVHSVRLPGIVLAFEAIFGLPNERLTIRHDAGKGAGPYVRGALLAVRRVMQGHGVRPRPGPAPL
jgi:4-hydroxy-tetrahydrodipicolinate reductase